MFLFLTTRANCIFFLSKIDLTVCVGQQGLSCEEKIWLSKAKTLFSKMHSFGRFQPGCLFFWLFIQNKQKREKYFKIKKLSWSNLSKMASPDFLYAFGKRSYFPHPNFYNFSRLFKTTVNLHAHINQLLHYLKVSMCLW